MHADPKPASHAELPKLHWSQTLAPRPALLKGGAKKSEIESGVCTEAESEPHQEPPGPDAGSSAASSSLALEAAHDGAEHQDLKGAEAFFRYRPDRLPTADFTARPTCRFWVDGEYHGPVTVVDISSTGLAVQALNGWKLPPGTVLKSFQILHKDAVLWSGDAQVVHLGRGPGPRVGITLRSGIFDVQALQFCDQGVEKDLRESLARIRNWAEALPAEWRAKVASVRQYLDQMRQALDLLESSRQPAGWWRQPGVSTPICRQLFSKWYPPYSALCAELDEASAGFEREQLQTAQAYVQNELIPAYLQCPMHGRAWEKPLGYAGDYRLMELGQMEGQEGDSLFAHFLHYVGKECSFGKTVTERGITARRAARELIEQATGPVRIVSLACGPAVEMRRLFQEIEAVHHPVELILIDQDLHALRDCHDALAAVLLQRFPQGSPVTLHCLHFSLRQIVAPKKGAETELVRTVLQDVDMIYSMGLYDYILQPLARRMVTCLYGMLKPGGRVFIGNLRRVPDCSWVMEYALAWHLVYRTDEQMLDLSAEIQPPPDHAKVTKDATENCLFLDVRRPALD
ncbi:MAG: hypothetical protein H8E31_00815 [Planctomycetes bacterium]|nr:hypothetical protein [Planctomycetota bacterium]